MTEMTTSGTISSPGKGIRVALFATCINDTMYPQTARAVENWASITASHPRNRGAASASKRSCAAPSPARSAAMA